MSPSSAELLRQVKSQIQEVDPSEVQELLDEGVAIVDVREADEFASGHLPGAKHVPRGYLESRIEGVVGDRSAPIILYCASGNRSAYAARTLQQDLGYEHVRSMTGGITLWKDRGYKVVVPRTLTPEQRDRYSRHLLVPEIGADGPAEAARRACPAARRRRPRLADRPLPRRGRRRNARHRRRRQRRSLQPATPGDPHERARRRAQGRLGRGEHPRPEPRRGGGQVPGPPGLREHHGDHRGLGRDRGRRRQLPNPLPAERRLRAAAIPVVSASILGFDGQLSVFKPYEGPCYRCLFREPPPAELAPSCGANGVLGVLPGTMGLLQATEVIKLILGIGEPAIGRLLLYDALAATLSEVKVHRDPDCPICSRDPEQITDAEMGVFPDYEAFCAAAG